MNKILFRVSVLSILFLSSCQENQENTDLDNASTAQKDASSFTNSANESLLSYLPFSDSTDYVNARRGFIATYEPGIIKGENDKTVYNIKEFGF